MRAILIAAAVALASVPAAADEKCRSGQELIDFLKVEDPSIQDFYYDGAVYFISESREQVLVVHFKAKCTDEVNMISLDEFKQWVAGKGIWK